VQYGGGGFTVSKSIPLSLDPGAAQVHAKLSDDGFRWQFGK
jgi:hypothetical protein